jgi:hypothetical protein
MKSRRVLKLPFKALDALRDHGSRQAAAQFKAGLLWQDHGLVFTSAVGTPLDAYNVRRSSGRLSKRRVSARSGRPEIFGTPSSDCALTDVNLEDIARLVGHSAIT